MTPPQLLKAAFDAMGVREFEQLATALYDGSYTEINLWEIFKHIKIKTNKKENK